mgnify:CR=1 FL=1
MKGIMAKDLQDYTVAKKIEEPAKKEDAEEDLVPETEISESTFTKMITNLNKEDNG